MIRQKTMLTLFGWGSRTTLYEWSKNEKKIVLKLIEKYFDEEDIQNFIEDGVVRKLEVSKQAIDVQESIYKDVKNLVDEKNKLNFEHPEKKVFFEFGNFLESLKIEDKRWIQSLKVNDYFENEEKIDNYIKEKYIDFLRSKQMGTIEEDEHLSIMKYYHFNTSKHYKIYFIKYAMWSLIPSKYDAIELEDIAKFYELPETIRRIPGSKKVHNILSSLKYAVGFFYGIK